MLIEHLPTHLN
jgi:hypothetical protein